MSVSAVFASIFILFGVGVAAMAAFIIQDARKHGADAAHIVLTPLAFGLALLCGVCAYLVCLTPM